MTEIQFFFDIGSLVQNTCLSGIITTEKPYTILRFKIFYSDELWLMYNNSFSPNNVKIQKHIIKVNVTCEQVNEEGEWCDAMNVM